MKKYKLLKILSLLLVTTMLFTGFPIAAVAETIDNTASEVIEETADQPIYENITDTSLDDTETDVYILAEDTTKRGEFEKHYLCSDGTFVAVTYAEAVHYRDDNNEWVDIDNSLSVDETNGVYEAQNGNYKISFYTASTPTQGDVSVASTQSKLNGSGSKLITMQSGDSTLSWTLTANKKLQSSIGVGDYTLSENSEQTALSVSSSASLSVLGRMKNETENNSFTKINVNDEVAFSLPKVSNTVIYNSLFGENEGISVRYTAYRNKIEEDIFIERKTDIESFSMSVDCAGLIPVLNPDNSIDFIDKNGERAYHISIPYMIDATYAVLNDIQVTLSVQGDKCIITYTPDSEWLNSSDRVYPIMLDPSVTTKEYQSNVEDTYIKNGDTANHSDEQNLSISFGNMPVIAFNSLPVIHDSLPIQKATLNLTLLFAQFNETPINLEVRVTDATIDEMTYDYYSYSTLEYSTSSTMFQSQTAIAFDWTQDFHDIYTYIDDMIFVVKLNESNSNYSYNPICSSENTNGAGPYMTITYGYAFSDEFNTGDLLSFQNIDNGRYINLGAMPYSTAETTPNSTNLAIVKNISTGGYKIKSTGNSSLYLTVNDEGRLIWSSDNVPERQEWLFVPTGYWTFYIVLRADMSRTLMMLDQGHYENGEWIITNGRLYCYKIDDYTCMHCYGNHQEWHLYENGAVVETESGEAYLETGTYYINSVIYGGFLTRSRTIAKGFSWEFGDNIKWVITNLGNNQYTIQTYNDVRFFLSCTSTGAITLVRRDVSLTDDCIWEIAESSIPESSLLSIKNKATGLYIYYDGTNIVTEDDPTNYAIYGWRIYLIDVDYGSALDDTSFADLTIDIGEPAGINISLPSNYGFLSLQDFKYTVLSGDDGCIKFLFERGRILGLKAGAVQIQARHVLTGRIFLFCVTVEEQLYSIQIDQDRTFDMRQIINGVSEWQTDNPDVISHSHTTVFKCIESGYALVSGYDFDGGLLALVEVRGMTQKDKMLEALTTNETYYLYHQGPCGLNSLASDICLGTSRDFFEVKLVLISSFRQWYNGNFGIEWVKSRILTDFGFSINTDRAEYVTAEYESKGLGGYYNPEVQIENLNELLNNIKALIAMCGFNYAKTLYADDFVANMTTSAQADVQAAYQRHRTVVNAARQAQIGSGYKADNFGVTVLKKGTKIYRVCESAESLHQGAWYTTKSDLVNCGYDYNSVYSGLQLKKDFPNYKIAEYVINTDIYVATGQALSNTDFGTGGFIQYYISYWDDYVDFNNVVVDLLNIPT